MEETTATEVRSLPFWICNQIGIHANEFLIGILAKVPWVQSAVIASLANLRESAESCFTCQKLLKYFTSRDKSMIRSRSGDALDTLYVLGMGSDILPTVTLSLSFINDMILLPQRTRVDQEFYYVDIDRNQANLQQIRRWIEICDNEHGDTCRAVYGKGSLPLPPSMLLIDVHNACLVQAYEQVSYICLSYVWGSEPSPFQAITHNLDDLQQQRSLEAVQHRLPATVKDAISLTAKLGMRYLWVDRLCILQDDRAHQGTQIRHMAGIYNNATLTICATDGEDAEYGLRGIGNGSRPRLYEQMLIRFGNTPMFASCEDDFREKDDTKWYTRGWTYQERLLSNRRLVFNHQLVKWVCRKVFWSETANPARRMIPRDNHGPHPVIPRHPLLDDYFRLTKFFKTRALGCEKDGLNAFEGILSSLNKSFPGGFHFGLPQCMFNHAMLWLTSIFRNKRFLWMPSQRRVGFPSWSWVGWQGPIEWLLSSHLYDPTSPDDESIQSMVKWKRRTHDGQCFDIKVLYDYWRSYQHNTYKTPPPGWKRVIENINHGAEAYLVSESAEGGRKPVRKRVHYTNEWISNEALGYPNRLLYHPVPTHRATSFSDERDWTPVLHGRVQTSVFSLQVIRPNDQYREEDYQLDILDRNGEIVGGIFPDIEFEFRCAHAPTERFIGISKGVEERRSPPDIDIFVLWIEWKDGIAYRLGVGKIREDAWLRSSPEEVDLQLG